MCIILSDTYCCFINFELTANSTERSLFRACIFSLRRVTASCLRSPRLQHVLGSHVQQGNHQQKAQQCQPMALSRPWEGHLFTTRRLTRDTVSAETHRLGRGNALPLCRPANSPENAARGWQINVERGQFTSAKPVINEDPLYIHTMQ